MTDLSNNEKDKYEGTNIIKKVVVTSNFFLIREEKNLFPGILKVTVKMSLKIREQKEIQSL